jgi:hypothetical protein
MSELQDFAKAAFAESRTTIGGEPIAISGGATISAVLAERTASDQYDGIGFSPSDTFTAVVDAFEFATAYPSAIASYKGKSVEARGVKFRLREITQGASFVTMRLETITRP